MEIVDKAVDILAKNVTKEKNILKVVEECAELQEVLVKYLTKSEELKPKQEKIVEEMGDVVFRIMVLARAMNIEKEVDQRMQDKATQMYNWAVTKFN
jgi:NTP pyrophosphatase (non-canonical NTP hydrolase)